MDDLEAIVGIIRNGNRNLSEMRLNGGVFCGLGKGSCVEFLGRLMGSRELFVDC